MGRRTRLKEARLSSAPGVYPEGPRLFLCIFDLSLLPPRHAALTVLERNGSRPGASRKPTPGPGKDPEVTRKPNMKFPLQKLDLKAFSVPGRLKGRTAIEEYQRVVADCPIYCGDGVLPKASRWQKPVPTMTPQSPIRHCVDEDLAGLWVVLEIIHLDISCGECHKKEVFLFKVNNLIFIFELTVNLRSLSIIIIIISRESSKLSIINIIIIIKVTVN